MFWKLKKRSFITCMLVVLATLFSISSHSAPLSESSVPTENNQWQKTLGEARGQTVYFNAWGGSQQINDYIRWAAQQVQKRYGIELKQVKVTDTADVVSRILAEKQAGRDTGGTVDIIWINGENFRSMKNHGLLFGPFTEQLPNYRWIDPQEKPTTVLDFGEPVEGLEAPWGMAQLVFIYDQASVQNPPRSAEALLEFAKKNPGRVTYPLPPDFVGTTFLKQLLLELSGNNPALFEPVDKADFEQVTAPLWRYLDELHPMLWRKGETFPQNNLALTPLLDDGEILLSMTFNPSYASSAIANGELAESVRTYVNTAGTVGNTHFLAIPYNARAKAAAQVVIDFLMSPQAQLHKSDPDVWGDPTVLSMGKLNSEDKKRFSELPLGVATLSPQALGKALPEPHSSWSTALEAEWQKRYRQ
ncbi:ABC transporter substrate-binding protein [Endozoicomonas arenosclerae]|uniref:ABC transporter substrate-binding protein n=1 Tax=Endozoicomonas arenosclerae TaxID=1633495 RepID=UPI000A67EFA0|nr:ABC transporter substrate-binding protein [Endozoicomonas arenosclerae]